MSNLHLVKNEGGGKPGRSFYVALTLCLAAVAVAGWTTYDSVVHYADNTASAVQNVADTVSGVKLASQPALVPVIPSSGASSSEAPVESKAPEEKVTQVVAPVTSLSKPVDGEVLSPFSEAPVYNETLKDWRAHTGVDLAAQNGASVVAAAAGTVASVTEDPLYGTVVILSHEGGLTTGYSGLSGALVNQGDAVNAGQELGKVGAVPAEAQEESHLHFSLQKDGVFLDPKSMME